MNALTRTFSSIFVGESVSFEVAWTAKDVELFSKLSGDCNPLHMDESYATGTSFKQRVVHGMLTASSFSKLVGMYLPGKYCLFLKQTITFKKPVFINDVLVVSGTVISKSESTKMLVLNVSITKEGKIVVEGQSTVQMIES